MAADDDEELPDPDQVPPAVIGLDGLLAVVVAVTVFLLVSGQAWRHVGAFALALGVAGIVIVVRMIVRREHRAGRTS